MISIRYPSQQQGYDPADVDRSFDRAFTYGRERRDEKLATLADEKLRAALFGGGQPAQQPMSIAALAPQGYPGGVERAPLPDIASARVAQAHSGAQSPWPGAAPKQDRITPQDARQASMPPQGALEAYIRHAAKKRGIDPEIALKVAMSEGGVSDPYRQSDVVKNGVREQSYGPFQLYMNGGLGNEALAAGIDPRKDWRGGIDFALDKAAEGGWGPWMGAEKVGVTGRMGIGGGQQPMQVADASGGMPAPQGGPSGGNGLPDNETMRALFASPAHRPMAIELAKSAIAARQGDPEAALRLDKLSLEVEKLRNPTPESFTLGEGQRRFDAAGNVIAEGGAKNDAPTVQKLKLQDGSEMAVQWNAASGQWDPIDAPKGGADVTPRMKLTENQSKMTLFQSLQTETQPVLQELEAQFNPANIPDSVARSTPIAGNFFQSEQGQMYSAAATAWAEGALRIATGAAATPEEMERTKRAYFAQPGDTPLTIAFKSQMRDMYSRAIQRGLGEAPKGGLPKPSDFIKQFDAPQGGGPAVGTVEDGYRLQGGDPADPNSWEPAN